ncbi:nuclear polyadenylated RNA-binding protein 3 [Capsicum galapagoense]
MAEAGQDEEEHTFPLKRTLPAEEEEEAAIVKSHEDEANKKQKLDDSSSVAHLNEIDEDDDDYEEGKGILRDDKGKGKLIEDSDSDDSTDFGGESDADTDTDLSDDLLAEVDLGNIIPSRTRRPTHRSSLKISDDPVKPDGTGA